MLNELASLIRVGFDSAKRLFSGKPADGVVVKNDSIHCVCDGAALERHLRDVKHVSVQQSFLGLFGASLSIRFIDNVHRVVKGLDDREAWRCKARIESGMSRVSAEDAQARLTTMSGRIADAYAHLSTDAYFSAVYMKQWLEEYGDLRFLNALSSELLKRLNAPVATMTCRHVLMDPATWLRDRNLGWVAAALHKHKQLLDTMSKTPLTKRQREAILTHDNRVLAVAGAGTGKTTTVIGKVSYLLKTGWCKPEEILLLSFSRSAVNELKDRVSAVCGDKVVVRTFHSLGLEIIAAATGRKPAVFEQSSDVDVRQRVERYLKALLADNDKRKTLLSFLAYHYFPDRAMGEFRSRSEFLQYASRCDIRTLKGEPVRSNQEVQIANWLFLNGIDYVYEAEFKEQATGNRQRRVYKPDFRLVESGIYIEHFGIDRNGNTAPWIPRAKYHSDMAWKRQLHRECRTTLVETFSYQAREGVLIDSLKRALARHGIHPRPIPAAELAGVKELEARLRPMAKLLATALCLYKGDRLTMDGLRAKISVGHDGRRATAFLEVFGHVLHLYELELREKGEVDFGDMVTRAANLVETGAFKSPFRAVIVDEFQDISRGRAWLLNALLEQHEDARLLCVGDDWQSVYRFTGSDVSLMTKFREQWPQAIRVDLDETFRFNDKVQAVSESFVTANPAQLRKSIRCHTSRSEPAVHIVTTPANSLVAQIIAKNPNSSLLVLGRYNHTAELRSDVSDYANDSRIRIMTVHKSKGLEADHVIVNGVASGRYGFPTEMVDDPLLSLFLADADPFPNAEERRLFYVALTRARHDVWLCVDRSNLSPFIRELQQNDVYKGLVDIHPEARESTHRCPLCDGPMLHRFNRSASSLFLGCISYPRCKGTLPGCPSCRAHIPELHDGRFTCPASSCGWTSDACQVCGIGFLQESTGRFGKFKGCSMFSVTGCRGSDGGFNKPR